MGWNKDGSTVKAMYLSEYPVTGVVMESRVKYGGSVSYWLKLTEPFFLNGSIRETLMVDENQVTHDFGVIDGKEEIYT
jgi:hypothetical protein